MVDIYLDPVTGDLDFTNNTLRLTENLGELTRQKILITLQTFRGEWGVNINFGIPWLKNKNNPIQLLGPTNKAVVDRWVREATLNVEAVRDFEEYLSVQDKQLRSLETSFRVNLTDGSQVSIDNFTI